jgi:hypothetical protein
MAMLADPISSMCPVFLIPLAMILCSQRGADILQRGRSKKSKGFCIGHQTWELLPLLPSVILQATVQATSGNVENVSIIGQLVNRDNDTVEKELADWDQLIEVIQKLKLKSFDWDEKSGTNNLMNAKGLSKFFCSLLSLPRIK